MSTKIIIAFIGCAFLALFLFFAGLKIGGHTVARMIGEPCSQKSVTVKAMDYRFKCEPIEDDQ